MVNQCLLVGRQYQLQRRIVSAESVSTELFKNGLRLAANRHLLKGDAAELVVGRPVLLAELRDVLRRLDILVGWDPEHRLRREGELAAARAPAEAQG